MANNFTIKQHDRLPPFITTLRQTNDDDTAGPPLDLSDVPSNGAKFIMKKDATVVQGTCTILNASLGRVQYDWAAGDTNLIGDYTAEIELTYADGRKRTIPNETTFPVHVVADLA